MASLVLLIKARMPTNCVEITTWRGLEALKRQAERRAEAIKDDWYGEYLMALRDCGVR